MTDEEWQGIEAEAKGLWGTSNREMVDQKLAAWRKRWRHELRPTMTAALKILEHTAEHWPSVAKMHAAVDEVKSRFRPVQRREREPDAPMSARDWADMAATLVSAANQRASSGRGKEGDRWHGFLFTLAEHYEQNAVRLRAGEEPLWPPPRFDGMPRALVGMLGAVPSPPTPAAPRVALPPPAADWHDDEDAA